MKEELIQKNLEMMAGCRIGGMKRLLMFESFGGNAGYCGREPCAAANFYYNAETGEIVCFGNHQDVSQDIREKYQVGFFRVTLGLSGRSEIVDFDFNWADSLAGEVLNESARRYNLREKSARSSRV